MVGVNKVTVHKEDGEALELRPKDVVFVDSAELVSKPQCKTRIVLTSVDEEGRNKQLFVVEPTAVVAQQLDMASGGRSEWAAG